jgi:hypothetical protein
LQEFDPQRGRQPLRFGEPALGQELTKAFLDQRPLGRFPAPWFAPRLFAAVAQELSKNQDTVSRPRRAG